MKTIYLTGIALLLSSVAGADELSFGAKVLCLPQTGQLEIAPVFVNNITTAAKTELVSNNIHVFDAVSGTLPIKCSIQKSQILEGIITYQDVGNDEAMGHRQAGECAAPDTATLSLQLNGKPIAYKLPLANACTWGHLQSVVASPYGVTACYQTPGGPLEGNIEAKVQCKAYIYKQLLSSPLK